MKFYQRALLILVAIFGLSNGYLRATNWSVEFADAIIARWPNSINDMTGKKWEYSNSIVLHGIEKVYEETGDVKYLNYIKDFADDYIDSNGNITYKSSANNLDYLHPSLLCIFLYEQTGQEKYKKAAENTRKKFNTHPRNSVDGYWHKDNYPNQMWLDGIYMAEPFLVKYGNMFNDTAYCSNEATFQMLLLADHAYDNGTKLLYHGWDITKASSWADNTTGVSPEVWSRALGWYVMAMVDVMKYLPPTHAKYDELIALMNNIAEGLKNYQDATTGLWYQVVDKGSSAGNWIETSGSGMFIYGLKHAIDRGYIDASYMTVVNKAWTGLQNYITLDGSNRPVISSYVGGMGILDNYSAYVSKGKETCPPSVHPHGYCGFLMAATAMENTPRNMFQTHISIIGDGNYEFITGGVISDSGKVVTLKAISDEGSSFVGWSGDVNSTNSTVSFTITGETNISMNFSGEGNPDPSETIFEAEDANWSEGSVVETEHVGFSGTGYVNTPNAVGEFIEFLVDVDAAKENTFNLTYASGATSDRQFDVYVNDVSVLTNQSCAAGAGWTDYIDATFDVTLVTGSNTIKIVATTEGGLANIDKLSREVPNYTLTVLVEGNGSVDYTKENSYPEGTSVNIVATADEGAVFTGWSGDVSDTEPEIDVVMTKNYTITANFDVVESVVDANAKAMSVYPNPVEETLYISTVEDLQSVEVYDAKGSCIKVVSEIENNSINLSGLSNGLYLVKVVLNGTTFTQQFIKK